MATSYFKSVGSLTSDVVPGIGDIENLGNSIVGAAAMQRILIQFMNGAPIVDYGSVTITPVAGDGNDPDGKIEYLDTRVGAQVSTSGYTTNTAQTWTLTFTSPTAFDVSGSSSGAQAAGTVGTDYLVEDLIGFKIEAGAVNAWETGDVITFNVILNPNTTNKWKDPDPQNYNDAAGTDDHNKRLLFADPVGLGTGTDFVYTEISYSDATTNEHSIGFRGARGYQTDGTHPAMTNFMYLNLWDDAIAFYLSCTERRVSVLALLGSDYKHAYAGLINTYTLTSEWAYPYWVGAESNQPYPWDLSTSSNKFWAFPIAYDGNNQAYLPSGIITDCQANSTTDAAGDMVRNYPFMNQPVINAWGDNQGTLLSLCKPPRLGNSQVPLFPCYWFNRLYGTTTDQTINGTAFMSSEIFGEVDEIYGVGKDFTSAGTTITIGGADYLVFDGWNSDTHMYNYTRAAMKIS